MGCQRTQGQKGQLGLEPKTRKHRGLNLLPLLIICIPDVCIPRGKSYPPFSHAARHHGPRSCPTPMSLFPLYRLAFSASQTCSWKRLPLICLCASNQMKQALVSASSKCPQTESSWPNLGQVSTLIKFSVTGRGSWEQEDRSGPAPWNGEPFPGVGRLWNGWGKHPSDCCKLQVRDVSEFGIFFSFWNFLESAFTEV